MDLSAQQGTRKPGVVLDFVLQVRAHKGGEIIFEEVRQFIERLKTSQNFDFQKVTFDGWQSLDSIQQLAGTDVQARAGTYLLFARLFRQAPSEVLLREIVQRRLLTLAEQWGEGSGSLDPAEDPRWPHQTEAIAVEYARLFVVPGEQAVHPYESAYCDTLSIDTSTACSAYFGDQRPIVGLTGFIGGSSASVVARAYAEAGFELNPAAHELPDHLSIELEFMGRLLERGNVDDAKTFFQEHLGRWAFRCLEYVKRNAPAGFYRIAADTLTTFLQHEQQFLK